MAEVRGIEEMIDDRDTTLDETGRGKRGLYEDWKLDTIVDLSRGINETVEKLWDRVAGRDYLDIEFACPKGYQFLGPEEYYSSCYLVSEKE